MCGIVGLYLKQAALQPQLGALFAPMLAQMSERGPDSAGIAVYRELGANGGRCKLTLHSEDSNEDWSGMLETARTALGNSAELTMVDQQVLVHADGNSASLREWLQQNHPHIRIMGSGDALEIYKGIGLPCDVMSRFDVPSMGGTHMIGHTRMATESAVTTAGAHPFATGDDLCLVHNGSLSNHNRLREWLRSHAGVNFQTDNDSEVAAGYLTWRLSQGLSIAQALEASLNDLDGFYTFAVGTRDGFAVLRDPIACKPAVMAETDDWVAMASEFRALAELPGVEHAQVWEPEPATVYSWGKAA